MTFKIKIENETETIKLGKKLATFFKPGDVVGLRGDLGAGKTFLSRIISRALGVPQKQTVNSPTFTLINEYFGGVMPIYHMDLYRLGDPDELYELGIWEYYEGDGLCLVEWYDKFDDLWPEDAIIITIKLLGLEEREFSISGNSRAKQIISNFL